MNFPEGDNEFKEQVIDRVEGDREKGWSISYDGWGFFVPETSPIEPKVGMTARFYGRGIGSVVRGLFLNGTKVFYRTEAEEKEHSEIAMYGADAADWLRRWDAGKSVFSISMGGLGPGYEQCIQITAAEILRHLLEAKYEPSLWQDHEVWKRDRKAIEKVVFANKTIDALGLSGAQWGAALNLAINLYRDGPRGVMSHPEVRDRHIQVSRTFPGMAA